MVLAALALALGAFAFTSMVCRAVGGPLPNPGPKLAALAPVATLPSVAAVAIAATIAWWLAALLAIPAVILMAWQFPRIKPKSAANAPLTRIYSSHPSPPPLRIMTLNLQCGKARAEAIIHCLRTNRVHVLAAQELTPEAVNAFVELGIARLLPFSEVDARPGYTGTGIWSRWPLQPLPPILGLTSATPSVIVDISGQPINITAVHVPAPIHHHEHRWQHDSIYFDQH